MFVIIELNIERESRMIIIKIKYVNLLCIYAQYYGIVSNLQDI